MSQSNVLSDSPVSAHGAIKIDSRPDSRCSLTKTVGDLTGVNSNLCRILESAGCPLVSPVQERLRFETFLAELSATFVNVPASQVDAEIESALRQIVDFLGIDRSGFGEVSANGRQMEITHSYELPGVPPSPRCIVDERMPWYARAVWQGETLVFSRLPDDLPAEAIIEREYCTLTGLKSQLTIPLKVTGYVVGGIGFASLRSYRDWPDELVERLRLVGGIFTNALARKRADEALKAAEEQTRVLRDELAHATRQELVNHLATSIAHEVNQPFCAIASNAQTALELLDSGDIDEARCALHDMWSDAQRGSEIIGRIRSMVRKEQPPRSAACLAAIIEELRPLLTREARAKSVHLQLNLAGDDLPVLCDRVQLQQVVVNLFLNAVEAVSETSHRPQGVTIQAWRENPEWAHVSVSDTGAGLSRDDCERVFAPYFTTKRNGLGMGLGISRTIIADHGGKLWATPGLESGTVFEFRIPAALSCDP